MQYTVRNRRRLRTTGEQAVSRTMTDRGTGVAERSPIAFDAVPRAVPVRAQGTGSYTAQPTRLDVREVVPASVLLKNFDRYSFQ
ncbi:hypothetical protein BH11MYX2_BH11MYX2_20480 [soil metagenome]